MSDSSQMGTHITTQLMSGAAARNYYRDHPEALQAKVSSIWAFARGALSGLGSGVLMAGIVATIAPFATWATLAIKTLSLPTMATALGGAGVGATMLGALATTAPFLILATTLFSGVMAAKRAMSDNPTHNHSQTRDTMTIVPAGVTAPVISQSQETSLDTAEQASTKNWVATTSRSSDSQSRVQGILDKGMADKDRAAAILAARDAASNEPSQRLM